uniref:Uncharacterized protein n=1 Tax=Panagrolaimus sp. PS1159 TaxID=55785 RepID=A0AC35GNM4_9BILA
MADSESQEKSVEQSKKKETKSEENKIFSTTWNYLDRGPPEKDEQRPQRSSIYSSSQRRKSSNGRKVPLYCPYNLSNISKHRKKEERLIIPQKNAIEIIAEAKKEAERGIKENGKPRERSSSVSNIDSVKRENTSKSGPSSNIPNYEIQDEEPMEVDGSSTVAEHIRRFDDGNPPLENRRNDNSPKDRHAHKSHKHRDLCSVDRDDDERRYNSTTPERPHKHHDPSKFLASTSSNSSRHETLKRYGRRKKKNQKRGRESPKRSRTRPKSSRVRDSSRRHRHDHRSPLRSSGSVSPRRLPSD